jgi:putative aminopeptidase FrvX
MKHRFVSIGLCIMLFIVFVSFAEETNLQNLIEILFPVPSPTGYEEPLVETVMGILPQGLDIKRDNLGGLYVSWGKNGAGPALCTPLDEAGYFVSGINPEGYLTLDRAVYLPSLADSFNRGHPMIVWTGKGPVEGVWTVPSVHILTAEMRKEMTETPALEMALLDIGASSAEEARAKGVEMLDAVTPWREITNLVGTEMAGQALGGKVCAALLVDLAQVLRRARIPDAEFVWMAQTKFMARRARPPIAMGALRASREIESKEVVVIDIFPCDQEGQRGIQTGKGPVLVYRTDKVNKMVNRIKDLAQSKGLPIQEAQDYESPLIAPFIETHEEIAGLFLPVRLASTPSEIVDFKDVESLKTFLLAIFQKGRSR